MLSIPLHCGSFPYLTYLGPARLLTLSACSVVSLFVFPTPQGPRPERPKEPEPDVATTAAGETDLASMPKEASHGDTMVGRSHRTHHGYHGIDRSEHDHGEWGRRGGDSRPKLAPGAMVTLSNLAAEAIMVFTEEVKKLSRRPLGSWRSLRSYECRVSKKLITWGTSLLVVVAVGPSAVEIDLEH